jgi:hypothetical protein
MRILIPSKKKKALQEAAGGPSLKPAEDICAIFYYQLIYGVFVVSPFLIQDTDRPSLPLRNCNAPIDLGIIVPVSNVFLKCPVRKACTFVLMKL